MGNIWAKKEGHRGRVMKNEEWRPIPLAKGYYEASDLGRIRSIDRTVSREVNGITIYQPLKGKVLSPALRKNGYYAVVLGIYGTHYVHRLVCFAWHGEPEAPNMDAAHKDGVRTNNVETNLKWKTRTENFEDQLIHGTRLLGEKHNGAVLTEEEVRKIRLIHASGEMGYELLARNFGVHTQTIASIIKRRTWQHIP